MKNIEEILLKSSLGRGAIYNSLLLYRNIIPRFLGEYAIQISFCQIKYLHYAKHRNKYYIDSNYSKNNENIVTIYNKIPIKTEQLDLIIFPFIDLHINNLNHILFECYRILKPNGKIIITAINPNSFLSIISKTNNHKYIISPEIMQKFIIGHGFRIESGNFINYGYNFPKKLKLLNSNNYNLIGNRWFPTNANIYSLCFIKDIINPIQDNQKTSFILPDYIY
jgi:SAM-dependent methyltransferase